MVGNCRIKIAWIAMCSLNRVWTNMEPEDAFLKKGKLETPRYISLWTIGFGFRVSVTGVSWCIHYRHCSKKRVANCFPVVLICIHSICFLRICLRTGFVPKMWMFPWFSNPQLWFKNSSHVVEENSVVSESPRKWWEWWFARFSGSSYQWAFFCQSCLMGIMGWNWWWRMWKSERPNDGMTTSKKNTFFGTQSLLLWMEQVRQKLCWFCKQMWSGAQCFFCKTYWRQIAWWSHQWHPSKLFTVRRKLVSMFQWNLAVYLQGPHFQNCWVFWQRRRTCLTKSLSIILWDFHLTFWAHCLKWTNDTFQSHTITYGCWTMSNQLLLKCGNPGGHQGTMLSNQCCPNLSWNRNILQQKRSLGLWISSSHFKLFQCQIMCPARMFRWKQTKQILSLESLGTSASSKAFRRCSISPGNERVLRKVLRVGQSKQDPITFNLAIGDWNKCNAFVHLTSEQPNTDTRRLPFWRFRSVES